MTKFILRFCSIIAGSTFFVSGIVKINDILGFSYKLEEYFEDGALAYRVRNILGWENFSLAFFIDYSLIFAIAFCLIEVIFGLNLIFNVFRKVSSNILLLISILFLVLTFHTATCDPLETFVNKVSISKTDPLYQSKLKSFSENTNVTLDLDTEEYTRFNEVKSVQCVTDCGCFGDAMKGSIGRSLTPWESFTKDVILLILLFPIVFLSKGKAYKTTIKYLLVNPLFSLIPILFFCWLFSWYSPLILFLLITIVVVLIQLTKLNINKKSLLINLLIIVVNIVLLFYSYNYLPFKDFRSYAVGSNVKQKMTLPENAKQAVFEQTLLYTNKTTGVTEKFNEENYPWDDSNYVFVDRASTLIEAGDEPEITDFSISSSEGNFTESFLNDTNNLFILTSHNLNKAREFDEAKLNEFIRNVQDNQGLFIGLTASLKQEVKDFKEENKLPIHFYSADGISLKTVIRANPGVVWFKNGVIKGKWPLNQLPEYSSLK